MSTMSNVSLPVPPIADPAWTVLLTAANTNPVTIHNRTPDSPVLVRINSNLGTINDPADAPAEVVLPLGSVTIVPAIGDVILARMATVGSPIFSPGRVTVRQ